MENEIAFDPMGELTSRLTARLHREHRAGIGVYSYDDRPDPEEEDEDEDGEEDAIESEAFEPVAVAF